MTLGIANWVATSAATQPLDALALLAAGALAYTLGEAIGRLACLSFGCCYGKPMDKTGPLERALYGRSATTYRGKLKKISYASNLENTPVVPVQSIASVVLFGLFLAGLWLFWRQYYGAALGVCLWGSQLWRIYSETLRADYLVGHGALVFVAEVKTGLKAPRVETPGTRRQLLEYRIAFDVDGVLLVDVDAGRIQAVTFPLFG